MIGDAAATWSSEPLNALECDPDRSSPELSVRDELRPESDLSASAYGAAAVMAFTVEDDDEDDVDDEDDDDMDCRSLGGKDDVELARTLLVVGTPTATAAGNFR